MNGDSSSGSASSGASANNNNHSNNTAVTTSAATASTATVATTTTAVTAANSFAPLTSLRSTAFPATTTATKNMAVPSYLPAPAFRPAAASSQSSFPSSLASAANGPERDLSKKPLGSSPTVTPPTLSSALIRNLPANTTEESLRLMMVFSTDLVDVELLPVEQVTNDKGFRSAILKFKTPAGAQEAKRMLDGKSNITNDAELVVEILGSSSPTTALGNRFPTDSILPTTSAATGVSMAPTAPSSRQTSRFNGTFQALEKMPPPSATTSDANASSYQKIFGPQSPIGNHLANGSQITSKSLIDSVDDDETKELINDPVGFAENGLQRRQTAPQLPISAMANLSLNTNPTPPPAPVPYYGHPGVGGVSGHPNTMSPTAMGPSGPGMGYHHQPPYRRHYPPINPADQNPPCNTLYVGNLPHDTSEEELKAMFSKQRGYKRLCFRTKANGPMCFVEFEDVTFATKALHELYGQPLHNSVKGGIRLSFSKNPLGVRSNQNPNNPANRANNGFTTASGPPPGLTAPPGLGGVARGGGYTAPSAVLGAASTNMYGSPTATPHTNPWGSPYGGYNSVMSGPSAASYPPAYMMGR